jgi:hypothetical protein
MKKVLMMLLFAALVNAAYTQNKVRYDNGAITSGANFVTTTSWGRLNITYRFINGTTDIAGTAEQNAVRDAFQIWADYAPLAFTEVTGTADISISWAVGNHGDGAANAFDGVNGVLAHAFAPNPSNAGGLPGDVHFDDAETWTLAERGDPFQPIDLVSVAAHEIGHALGLAHSNVACALMNEFYTSSHRYLAPDDIAGIRALYGTRSAILPSSAALCTALNASFRNVPTGGTVTNWTSSNTSVATVSNTGVITRVGNTTATVTIGATLNLPCGLAVVENRLFYVGIPIANDFLINGSSQVCVNRTVSYATNFFSGITYNWSTPGFAFSSGGGPAITATSPPFPGFGQVVLSVSNACGTISPSIILPVNFVNFCFARFVVSPNPAKGMVTITTKEPAETNKDITPALKQKSNTENQLIRSVKITDHSGAVMQVVHNKQGTKQITFSLGNIKPGKYVLSVFDGNSWESQSLVIQ